jgi:hypothetical protein
MLFNPLYDPSPCGAECTTLARTPGAGGTPGCGAVPQEGVDRPPCRVSRICLLLVCPLLPLCPFIQRDPLRVLVGVASVFCTWATLPATCSWSVRKCVGRSVLSDQPCIPKDSQVCDGEKTRRLRSDQQRGSGSDRRARADAPRQWDDRWVDRKVLSPRDTCNPAVACTTL